MTSAQLSDTSLVPDHDLIERIGRGGYGEVWLARNRTTHTLRAVKIVFRDEFEDERPYQREFEGLLKFEPISRSHPSQLAILHVGRNDEGGCFYYVMELADQAEPGPNEVGRDVPIAPRRAEDSPPYHPRTLRSEIKSRRRLPAAEVIELGRALSTALTHLHSHGLVHRDIKPANIVYVGGVPKLADIGLVTDASNACSIVGTEGYIPPEGPGSPQADLYSLGKVLYEAATGRDRRDYPALPDDLRSWPDANLLTELNAIILRACAADPRRRYQSAERMGADLELLCVGKSVKRRQRWQTHIQFGRKLVPIAALIAVGLTLVRSKLASPATITSLASETFETCGTRNREAYAVYAQGREAMRNSYADGCLGAISCFEQAVAKDPKFARAWAQLALTYGFLDGFANTAPRICRPKSREAALKAIALNNRLAEAHQALGNYKMSFEWDWTGAEKEFREAIELAPRDPGPRVALAELMTLTGRPEEAIQQVGNALELNPSDIWLNTALGIRLACAGKKSEGLDQIRKTLAINPSEADALYQFAKIHWSMGELDSAMSEFERFFVLIDKQEAATNMANAHQTFRAAGLAGWSRFYLSIFEERRQNQNPDTYLDPINWIWIYMSAGDMDNAFKWLDRACDDHDGEVLDVVTHPFYERLWADPRFELMIKRMGLANYRH